MLQALRQPLESGWITITRSGGAVAYPARFALVAATNPCPCGWSGDVLRTCRCTPAAVDTYRRRLSGPLLDRIDLQVAVRRVPPEILAAEPRGEPSAAVRERVVSARSNFPARNYTIAQLADVVVVVEAAEGSGALITTEAALDLHKEVMAVPGSVFSPLSVGTHGLLRDGAGLVQNARDVLAALELGGEVLDDPLRAPESLGIQLRPERDGIVSHLSDVLALNAAEIARKLGLPISEVLGRLTALELEGAVRQHQGGYVRALRRGKERA